MENDDYPLLSIVTVNFNGKRFLKKLFDSIFKLDYPLDKLQVIMVDNSSSDGSIDYVNTRYPRVEVLALKKNMGYAQGNNEGFKAADGRYIALINNDCTVEPQWAKEMLSVFRQPGKQSKIGAVGSKVLFYYPYIPLELVSESSSINQRRLGVRVSSAEMRGQAEEVNRSIRYLHGFYPPQKDRDGSLSRWTNSAATLALPIADRTRDMEIEFTLYPCPEGNRLKLSIAGRILDEITAGSEDKKVIVKIPKVYFDLGKDIINSCGVKVNHSFYARERGFLSFDEGQYERIEEVFGLSGTSFMADKKMLEDCGGFDPYFFTYYEDIDLFWKARLKGWKNYFTPKAAARHYHCGTGKEWSYSFTYHVLRNRMIMIFKCGWPALVLRSYAAFTASMVFNLLYYTASLLRGRKPERVDIPIRLRLFFEFFYLFARNLGQRIKVRSSAVCRDKDIKQWLRDF